MRGALLAVTTLAAVAAASPGQAAPPASDAAQRGGAADLVVAPAPGQVVRSHVVRIRVRAGHASVVRVRLNGSAVGADLGRARGGVRGLRASISHGLRRGRNVVRVTVRRPDGRTRRATVRFAVRTRRPLVGAGRDRTVAVDGLVPLRGRIAGAERRSKARWTVVRAPVDRTTRRGPGRRAPGTATVTSPAGASAGFEADVPGRYTLQLEGGGVGDLVTIDATPRNKLVPIRTMTAADASDGDRRGIRVGDATFLLRDAVGRASGSGDPGGSFLQAVVLDRRTTGLRFNRKYADAAALRSDLVALDSTALAIVVLQPAAAERDYGPLQPAFDAIGIPDYGGLPTSPGGISAIGVPGMRAGQADVDVLPYRSGGQAVMTGYLTPDQYGGFTYVPGRRVPFEYVPRPSDPCVRGDGGGRSCDGRAGFFLRDQDGRTLAPGAKDGQFYETGTPGQDARNRAEAQRMAADLAAIPDEHVITIRTVSFQPVGQQSYASPIGRVDKDAMKPLSRAVARAGGTRDVFNRIAKLQGAPQSYGSTYTLVGWQRAGEGGGAEAGAGIDGQGPAAQLSGELRPDGQSRFQPAQIRSGDAPQDLSDMVFAPPTRSWPLDDDPGASAALSYLGTLSTNLGPDPRAAYWTQRFPDAGGTWLAIANAIAAADWEDVPRADRRDFDGDDFDVAQRQLVQELRWVGNVRNYLGAIARPFSDNALPSWAATQLIADRIYKDAQAPDNSVALSWVHFTEILLDLAGPLTGDATAVVASLMELGVWAFGNDSAGRPTYDEVKIKADEVGSELMDRMLTSAASYWAMGNVIVSDPAKLEEVGSRALCTPGPRCAKQWSFTGDQANQVSADLARSVERLAYARLYPLAYKVFMLNYDDVPFVVRGAPRDPRTYKCNYWPWYYYSDTAIRYGTTAVLRELDPLGDWNLWRVLVLSIPPNWNTRWGTPPSDETLRRMFDPVPSPDGPDGQSPRAGGLGMSPQRFMEAVEADWDYWSPDSNDRPTFDRCGWR